MLHKRSAHSEIMSHINVAMDDRAEWADPEVDFRHLLNRFSQKIVRNLKKIEATTFFLKDVVANIS